MSEIRLSFVIPARNEEALIGEVLEAILASVARASADGAPEVNITLKIRSRRGCRRRATVSKGGLFYLSATEVARGIAAGYDFSGIDTIVDVGGGVGTMLAELLKANPEMRGILVELPHVLDRAASFLGTNKVDGRCELVPSDFFKSIPAGGNAYLLKWILHDWEDERALDIPSNCHAAMKGTGKLFVVEAVVSPGNNPSFAKLLDLNMLVMTGGCERTMEEWRALLEAARFNLARVIAVHPMASIIETHPAP